MNSILPNREFDDSAGSQPVPPAHLRQWRMSLHLYSGRASSRPQLPPSTSTIGRIFPNWLERGPPLEHDHEVDRLMRCARRGARLLALGPPISPLSRATKRSPLRPNNEPVADKLSCQHQL